MARPPQQRDWTPPRGRTGFGAGSDGGFPGQGGPDTRPGARSGPGRDPHGRAAGVLAFARAWGTGIVVLVITEYLQISLVYEHTVGRSGPQSFGSAMAVVHLPNLICVGLATWAAARMHPAPQREEPVRHVIAACTVPVAGQVLMLTSMWQRPGIDALGFWLSTAVIVTGCVLGLMADRLWRPDA